MQLSEKYKTKDLGHGHRKRGDTITEIIIHHSWTRSVTSCIRALRSNGCSTHFMIDRDGIVYRLLDEKYVAWHCVAHNARSLGIDLIRGSGQEITTAQYESLNELVKYLCNKYQIHNPKLHERGVFFHRDLRSTQCPGEIDETQLHFEGTSND